ncbi:EF-P beta-lysylation protein EpmB [Gammaproteobacteria bacterium 45_16_T64]|nr:EF-P beta-lysylation protein EpmB [Gammaproteobacteria bacterium 45_16_T64]
MITRTIATCQTEDWQNQLSTAFTSVNSLLEHLQIPKSQYPEWIQAEKDFPLRVPRAFVNKMSKGDINDPLLKQVLPLPLETLDIDGYVEDPLQELTANPIKGLLHKYRSRVLVILGSACAIHCRYCFRRHFPYQDNGISTKEMSLIIDYVGQNTDINEVILSGGDPLVTNNTRLSRLIKALEQIPHLRRIRFHTRTPVVIPERIDKEFIDILSQTRLQVLMVLHCNHAHEIDDLFTNAMAQLKNAGVTLLNQSVLLKGINDTPEALIELSESLFTAHILPYYLHLLDPVAGASHFDVNESIGKSLITTLLSALPGYLVPKLVREEAHRTSKTPISILTEESSQSCN